MWKSGSVRTGSTCISRWPRQAMFGVSAETKLATPIANAIQPVSVGSPSA